MLKVGNVEIITPLIDIIHELKAQLAVNGIERFYKIKELNSDVMVCCPIHTSKKTGEVGQETKPSCGISKHEIDEVPAGRVHCFSCGYTSSLTELISACFGYDDMGRFGVNWLLDNFVSIESKPSSRIPTIQVRQRQPKLSQTQDFITENELDGYRFIHPYMYKRRLTDEIIEKFDVGYDSCFRLKDKDGNLLPSIECITFPVWDSKGNCVFVARRAIHTKFFHYPTDADKPVYGLNFIPRRIRSVVVCESIFNALTCWAYGYPAIALIGTGSYEQIEILNKSHISRFVLALDPDEAGYKGKLRLRNKLSKTKLISELEIPQGKDVNDLSKEEFDSLPEYRVNHLDNVQYKKMIDALKK